MEFENVKKVKFIGNPDNYANLEWGNQQLIKNLQKVNKNT